MHYLVVLNLGAGNWHQGFPLVTAQVGQRQILDATTGNQVRSTTGMGQPMTLQVTGSLPPAPALAALYQRWQRLYESLYANLGWRRSPVRTIPPPDCEPDFEPDFELEEEDETHISRADFDQVCQALQQSLNEWLNAASFANVDRKLRTYLAPTDNIHLLITAESDTVLRLPWCLWHWLDDYPGAEVAVSPTQYARSVKAVPPQATGKVKILALLGDAHSTPDGTHQSIDIAQDRTILEQLPRAEVTLLVEPSRSQLTAQLWDAGWDILFFAGHSSSQGQGQFQVNSAEALTIDQLKFGLRRAIAQGLQLAIFNSCDGLGLAWDLADLHIPQVIVMREPVPDRVAQEFLKYFLAAYAGGRSLYAAVREAREKLQAMEDAFPCATWLPIICQNPAEIPPTWQELCGQPPRQVPTIPWQQWGQVVLGSLAITTVVVGVRWFSWLQPLELAAFDRLMQLRPAEPPDARLLVVTVTDADVRAEGNEPRRGSISDRTLARLLAFLQRSQAAAIGLDIYRDYPVSPNRPQLVKQLQQTETPTQGTRLIAICKRPDPVYDPAGVAPPPEVNPQHIGFSDFIDDSDGILRRHLLAMAPNPIATACTATRAFNVELAFHYLRLQGMPVDITPTGDLQLGDRHFPRLHSRTGGYQAVDTDGAQLLLNYRASPTPTAIAPQVTVSQILSGEVNAAAIKDRIVLIGITTASSSDYWFTPYGAGTKNALPGVLLQAQMVSQIISAALDRRPLLWVWPLPVEMVWLGLWAITGGLLAQFVRRLPQFVVMTVGAVGTLSTVCWLILIQGGWVPFVPAAIALIGASGVVKLLERSTQPEKGQGKGTE